jgi:hypothetical protein
MGNDDWAVIVVVVEEEVEEEVIELLPQPASDRINSNANSTSQQP